LISATHQNLAECVEKGRFRQDLYYRLNVIELHLPPLRERLDDVGLLADTVLARLTPPGTRAVLGPGALDALRAYSFPGNVRELENILERALAFANDGVIEVADLALRAVAPAPVNVPVREPAVRMEASAPSPASEPAAAEADAVQVKAFPANDELPSSLPDYLDEVERDVIRRALAKTHFNRTQAADLLGISFRQLRYRMQRLSIHEPDT
jgi:two-component system response regulator PilR (NtrC family)